MFVVLFDANLLVIQPSTTGAMASSFRVTSYTKPSKGVFRTQSYIQDRPFAEIVNGLKYFRSILDVSLEPKYASAFYPRKSAKMELLSKKSEILHKFVSLVFFKIVILKAASCIKTKDFLRKFLEERWYF